MNLLASIKKLKNLLKPGLITLIPVFFGCDAANDFGTEFALDTNVDVKFIEFELPSANLFLDSLRTDGEDKILAGTYDDPLTGNITAEGYFQFRFQSGTLPTSTQTQGTPIPSDTLNFDSLVIQFEVLNSVTTGPFPSFDLEVYELVDPLLDLTYLAGTKASLENTLGGSFSGPTSDILDDDGVQILNADSSVRQKIEFTAADALASSLFNDITSVIRDSLQFIGLASFEDLAITPVAGGTSLAEISTSSEYSTLTFYMNDPDDDSVYVMEFRIDRLEYSHITRDKSGTVFDGIVENENFDLADGKTVLDPTAGLTTTFSVDGVTSFFENNPGVLINAAILDLEISSTQTRDTIEDFTIYRRKSDGSIFGPASLQNSFSNIVMRDDGYTTRISTPIAPSLDHSTATYSLSPTRFFQSLYNSYQDFGEIAIVDITNEEDTASVSDLVLVSPTNITLRQTIFNNSTVKLRVYYTEVD